MLSLVLLATASAIQLGAQVGTLQADASGCADGAREGFLSLTQFPNVAACNGGWTVPGISNFAPQVAPACPSYKPADTRSPTCNRGGGDDGSNPQGIGCTAEDLCAAGWHVCLSATDFTKSRGTCTAAVPTGSTDRLLWLSRQSSTGSEICATGTLTSSKCDSISATPNCLQTPQISNDVFGCGNYGNPLAAKTCGAFTRTSANLCTAIDSYGWNCTAKGTENGQCETYTITHSDPATGGVLCCRDTTCLDSDGDQVCDLVDNCIGVSNADQSNKDGDQDGDACDPCPNDPKVDSSNYDATKGCPAPSGGDVVVDTDGDGIPDASDNCPTVPNADQKDCDKDGVGNACDYCPQNKNIQTGGPGVTC